MTIRLEAIISSQNLESFAASSTFSVSSMQRMDEINSFSTATASASSSLSGSISIVILSELHSASATRKSIKPSYPSFFASLVTDGTLTSAAFAISFITISEARFGSFRIKSATFFSADGKESYAETIFVFAGIKPPKSYYFRLGKYTVFVIYLQWIIARFCSNLQKKHIIFTCFQIRHGFAHFMQPAARRYRPLKNG